MTLRPQLSHPAIPLAALERLAKSLGCLPLRSACECTARGWTCQCEAERRADLVAAVDYALRVEEWRAMVGRRKVG